MKLNPTNCSLEDLTGALAGALDTGITTACEATGLTESDICTTAATNPVAAAAVTATAVGAAMYFAGPRMKKAAAGAYDAAANTRIGTWVGSQKDAALDTTPRQAGNAVLGAPRAAASLVASGASAMWSKVPNIRKTAADTAAGSSSSSSQPDADVAAKVAAEAAAAAAAAADAAPNTKKRRGSTAGGPG